MKVKINEMKMVVKELKWRCGESNPVPLACEASALPYELHPHFVNSFNCYLFIFKLQTNQVLCFSVLHRTYKPILILTEKVK